MHIPVLAGPALELLGARPRGVYVDCTAGAGGHSALILERLAPERLIALDRDGAAVDALRSHFGGDPRVTVLHENYGQLKAALAGVGCAKADGVLLDAGLSSVQLDDPARGFSFQADGPLDMRMDRGEGEDAAVFLTRTSVEALTQILREYGDVRPARRIAKAIVAAARAGTLNTSGDLAKTIGEALDVTHKAPEETRTVFQAIRIAVNDELTHLETGLRQAVDVLVPGGRLVVITFHSGEDRVAKTVLREAARPRIERHPDGRDRSRRPPLVKLLTARPVTPDATEARANPRAQSAKLRAVERLPTSGG